MMYMAGHNAPGIRFKIKCPYCGEIKESAGIKTHLLHKHHSLYKKDKYAALLDGNFYKSELVVFPQKETKAIKNPSEVLAEAIKEKPIAGKQAGAERSEPDKVLQPTVEGSQPSPSKKPKYLEIYEVKPKMSIKPEAQGVQKEDEYGCQTCGTIWNGFKPKCPRCGAELDYSQD